MLINVLCRVLVIIDVIYGRAIGSVRVDDGYGTGGFFRRGSFGRRYFKMRLILFPTSGLLAVDLLLFWSIGRIPAFASLIL